MVTYSGNPAHKRYPSRWGAPGLLSTKSECPPELEHADAERRLAAAIGDSIANGWTASRQGEQHPYLVWGRTSFVDTAGDSRVIVWEARVTNTGEPSYHAYPITPERHDSKLPRRIKELLWPPN